MPLPPVWVRRCLLAPAMVVAAFLLVTTAPLWAIVAVGLTALVPGHLRVPRVAWLVAFYLVWDAVALIALFALWVAAGFGWMIDTPRFQRAHHDLAAFMMRALFRQARWVLRLRIELDVAGRGAHLPAGPLLVASRHGGPGDSLVLIHVLLNLLDREPRIVLKDTLQWDPAIDVILNRLPNEFIAPAPFAPDGRAAAASTAERIGALAASLDDDDALVIFPEGGQFSPERRRRRIDGLRRRGKAARAGRAEAMAHVMAPRSGGLLAAVDAAPEARLLVVAHTGLEGLGRPRDLWRELPMDKRIVLHGWLLEPEEIPQPDRATHEERVDWLYDWWERIDRWIAEHPGPWPAGSRPAPEEDPAPVRGRGPADDAGPEPAGVLPSTP